MSSEKKTAEVAPPAKRKGPGRPPQVRKKEPLVGATGIRSAPVNPQHVVEMRCGDPVVLRSLWSQLKALEVQTVQLSFRADSLVFFAKERSGHSLVHIRGDASKFLMYYAQSAFDVHLSHKMALAVINTIDKKDTRFIDMMLSKDEWDKFVRIILGTTMDSIENHKLNLAQVQENLSPEVEEKFAIDPARYTVAFKFPEKYFKRKMADIALSKAKTVNFSQNGAGKPLVISYEAENGNASTRIPFNNPAKIDFRSHLAADETFMVTAYLDDLKAISNIGFTSDVEIFMDESRDILFKTRLDDAFEMRILTKLATRDEL